MNYRPYKFGLLRLKKLKISVLFSSLLQLCIIKFEHIIHIEILSIHISCFSSFIQASWSYLIQFILFLKFQVQLLNYRNYCIQIKPAQSMGNNIQACTDPCFQTCQLSITDKQMPSTQKYPLGNYQFEQHQAKNQDINVQSHVSSNQILIDPLKHNEISGKIAANDNKSSVKKFTVLNTQTIFMIKQHPMLRSIMSNIMQVPYDVVRLTASQKLNRTLYQYGGKIILKYQKQKKKWQDWKLHKNGYYINHLDDNIYAIFTQNYYFQGQLMINQGKILPINEGVLISEKGMYQGNFLNGKANGKGYFKEIENHTVYKGLWEQGKLIIGTIQNQQLKFQGPFVSSVAHGKGILYFKELMIKYEGSFQNGLLHDQNGVLQSRNYIYKGGFSNGYKQGTGCLIEKQKFVKNKLKVYCPNEIYDGIWHRDQFQGKPRFAISTNKTFQTRQK